MIKCYNCEFYDEDYECICPSEDKPYVCLMLDEEEEENGKED